MKNKKIAKAYLELNKYLDEEQKKLYDRHKNLKLSHNRKIQLLKKIDFFLKMQQTNQIIRLDDMVAELRHNIQNELENYGRMYWG